MKVCLVTENQASWLTAAAEVTSSNVRGFKVLHRERSCKKHEKEGQATIRAISYIACDACIMFTLFIFYFGLVIHTTVLTFDIMKIEVQQLGKKLISRTLIFNLHPIRDYYN